MVEGKFEYQMGYDIDFVEEWIENGITRINLNPSLPIGTIVYTRHQYPVRVSSTPRLKPLSSYSEHIVYNAIDRFDNIVELFEGAITQIVLPVIEECLVSYHRIGGSVDATCIALTSNDDITRYIESIFPNCNWVVPVKIRHIRTMGSIGKFVPENGEIHSVVGVSEEVAHRQNIQPNK